VRKLFDVDPWEGLDEQKATAPTSREQLTTLWSQALQILQKIKQKIGK